jgi:hypothetical protein
MALASLILSPFAVFFPFGIAAVVLGHVSRSDIRASNGRRRGTGVAFAGLCIGYLGLLASILLLFSAQVVVLAGRNELAKAPYARAALAERLLLGDPYKVSPEEGFLHQRDAVSALRLIHDRQEAYRKAHPDRGYTCDIYALGTGDDTESQVLRTRSRYGYQLTCPSYRGDAYVVTAVPNNDGNPTNSPLFCVDESGSIRKSKFLNCTTEDALVTEEQKQ